jgi:hypothetical protein
VARIVLELRSDGLERAGHGTGCDNVNISGVRMDCAQCCTRDNEGGPR